MSCSCSNTSCHDGNSCNFPRVPRKTRYFRCDRDCVKLGADVKLKILFKDDCGDPVDPEVIKLTIKKPNAVLIDVHEIDPNPIVNADVGFYYYNYTPDATGEYTETWTVSIGGEEVTYQSKFIVEAGGIAVAPECGLEFNSLVVLELDQSIADVDGNTLGRDAIYSFSTEYNPFYASVEMLRMEVGPWVTSVPDDTIALAIHWSSLEADNITGVIPTGNRYEFARSRFVMYDAAIRMLTMPISNASTGGKRKQLGDLLIDGGGSSSVDFSLPQLLRDLKKDRDEWWRVVNAGGCIVPGQGLGPTTAVQGGSRNDSNLRSREWHDPWKEYYLQPTVNSRYRRPGEKKQKLGYTRWNEYYFTRKS